MHSTNKPGIRVSRAGPLFARVAILTAVFVLAVSGVAFADVWTDISDATWQNVYQVSAADASTVAEGFSDGTFRPSQAVTRGQFAKMAVSGLGIPLLNPPVPTFSDVPGSHIFYRHIEGATDAEVVSGFPDGTFRPDANILRQQANSILGRWLSQQEIDEIGGIQGSQGFYATLAAWFASEGANVLSGFADRLQIAPVHRPATAYLVMRDVVHGSSSGGTTLLTPLGQLSRVQAVAMIVRTRDVVFEAEPPTITDIDPAEGPAAGGTSVVITGTGFGGLSGTSAVRFGSSNATSYVVNSVTQITAVAPAGTAGTTVDVTVTTPGGADSFDGFTYLSPAKTITAFSFATPAATGVINESLHTIALTVPFGTNLSALVATFSTTGTSVSVGSTAQVSGTTPNDFTSPVTYTVTAADASTQAYVVTVTVAPAAKYLVTSSSYGPVAGTAVTISAQLADASGNAVGTAGKVVTWTKSNINGSFGAATSTTDASGLATVVFTTHTVVGTVTVTATDAGALTGTSAGITTVPGAAAKYLVTSSDYSPMAGDEVTISAQLADASGNAVSTADKVITWTESDASGSFVTPTGTTDASGLATVVFTTPPAVGSATTVTATDVGLLTGTSATITTRALAIGDAYRGGTLAYILQLGDPGYDADVPHGLIAAVADAGTTMAWSNITDATAGATLTAIGDGSANTTVIVNQGAGATSGAAKYCHDLVQGGHDDWYLPSQDELDMLYVNRAGIAGLVLGDSSFYWSSSEIDATTAFIQEFNPAGAKEASPKATSRRVRAIRAF